MAGEFGQGQPMQEPPVEGGEGAPGGAPSIDQMVVSIDQGLTQISQLIAQANPEAGQALEQLNEQYRQIITSVIEGAGGGAAPAGAQAPVSAQGGMGGIPVQ